KCKWFHDAIYRMIWSFLPIPYSLFFPKDVDVTMFFNYVIPPGVKGRKVTIVYDMAYKAYPETVRKRTKDMLDIALKKSCKRADKIITISEFSKREIIKYLGIKEDKIVVMPCGVNYSLYHNAYTEEEVSVVTAKYDIKNKYLLYLGTLEPRKNINRLIQAYALIKNTVPDLPKLVLAGRKGWMYDNIFEIVKELKLEKDIIFTGYVDEKHTPILMKGAEIFLFPSLYEGFGMPPLEAMACGTPVLVSNVASLPEVVGDAGVLVDPLSTQSIRDGLELLLKNNELRIELSRKGLERVKTFSWDRSVEIVAHVFEELR
ncbi:MAG: glycosyltransferase family 1 protein, partial [Candidatus Saccharimonadaceae bacterium]|nr:glycosyltransferase family 1 protein [Candidatus Saccharimonadaceae bacterium]